ncbi:hypothetical protein DICPUDRAFT_157492 [Dictyostelium purpureum]|uniref:Oxysterol binding family protein n=1 Tax=Dictyostelium purpureum TaxID=5786 RepID=F0ZZ98_DICPU|nr:uncharacterized protein DICPUDRAFT_157492 [Dictyostelium purpureum]EGC30730.1 hypothetical protein DICPUDRAFT_157492 [Dictyostelium purpureum]|eukprot:XP_003292741.1 hypothetical protein DICPUDRAFT_157492 [Dictyostelium purpureum]
MSNFFRKLVKKEKDPNSPKNIRRSSPKIKRSLNDSDSNIDSPYGDGSTPPYERRGEPNPNEPDVETTEEELENINFGPEGDADNAPEDKKSLWKKVSGLVGKDPMSLVSLPVYFFEPLTVLECQIEPLRFVELIEKASECTDSIDRLMYITAFNVAVFSSYVRTAKPFNPLLGETYEYIDKQGRYKSFCEQVSHHPPIGIAQTTSQLFDLQQESWITTKFWGNSLDVFSRGQNHLYLNKTGEHYTWKVPSSICHNIIFGKMWIEHYGELTVENHNTGEKAIINFQKSGWFEGTQKKISGGIFDAQGNTVVNVTGKWDKYVKAKKVSEQQRKGSSEITLWEAIVEPPEKINKWKHGSWIQSLNERTKEYEEVLPKSDSRLRMDRIYLEKEENKLANKEKNRIEEKERAKRREREVRGETWQPVYFKKRDDSKYGYRWDFNGKYWDERDKRVDSVISSKSGDPNFNADLIPEYDDSKLNINVLSQRKLSRDLTNTSTPDATRHSTKIATLNKESHPPTIKENFEEEDVTTTTTTTTTTTNDKGELIYSDKNQAKLKSFKEDSKSHTYIYSSPTIGHGSR